MNRDFTQNLVDASERHENLFNGDASEKTWLQRDIRDIDSLIEPGL